MFGIFVIFFFFFFLFNSSAQNVVYQHVTPDGLITFTDVPTPGSRLITLQNSNTSSYATSKTLASNNPPSSGTASLSSSSARAQVNSADISPAVPNYVLNIISPADQTTFQNQTPISVIITIQPSLQNGDQVQLILDGKPYGQPQAGLTFNLEGLERGTHQLQVRVMTGADQSTSIVSSTTTIYKQQASQLLQIQPTPAKATVATPTS